MQKSGMVHYPFSSSESFIEGRSNLNETKDDSESLIKNLGATEKPATSKVPSKSSGRSRNASPSRSTERQSCLKAMCNFLEPPNYYPDDQVTKSKNNAKGKSRAVRFQGDTPRFKVRYFRNRSIPFYDFKGAIAPVFTCFTNDENHSLELRSIPRYAAWLKRNDICGILVNSHIGEVNALSLEERKQQLEEWARVANEHDLICMVEIGADSTYHAMELARHAVANHVHAVFCNVSIGSVADDAANLIMQLQSIASQCPRIPFFYTHEAEYSPSFDLLELCETAEAFIPNFLGVLYIGVDLNEALRCVNDHRAVFLATETLMGPGLMLGFHAIVMAWTNVNPRLCRDIILAVSNNDLVMLRSKQRSLCADIWENAEKAMTTSFKERFNEKMLSKEGAGFSAGPIR